MYYLFCFMFANFFLQYQDENKKSLTEKEQNNYVPNENNDAYYYYKHILKTQATNRLRVTKKYIPSILYYCLNNCNDLTCAELSGYDGSLIATAHSNNIIKLWNLKKSEMNKVMNEKRDIDEINEYMDDVRKHESYLNGKKSIPLDIDEYNNKGVSKLYGNTFNVSSLSFGETDKILLSGNLNGDIYLYSTISNKNYVKYVGGHTPIWSIDTAFLGYFFATAEDDGNLRIYSTNKTYPFITYKYNCPVNVCKYHYNNTLVACGYYGNIKKMNIFQKLKYIIYHHIKGNSYKLIYKYVYVYMFLYYTFVHMFYYSFLSFFQIIMYIYTMLGLIHS